MNLKHKAAKVAISAAMAAATLFLATAAQASLAGRDITGNVVASGSASEVFLYDTVLNVTWLRDANANGSMTWAAANTWASGLNVGGYTGWRLPTMIDTGTAGCNFAYSGTDCGYNVQTKSGGIVYSEMASLYYDTLGNKGAYNTSGASQSGTLVNKGDFLNMQSFAYWSGLEYVPDPSNAWLFSPYGGDQNRIGKTSSLYALAVRPGDVVAAVPEPATYAMMLLGLSALVVAVRRRPR